MPRVFYTSGAFRHFAVKKRMIFLLPMHRRFSAFWITLSIIISVLVSCAKVKPPLPEQPQSLGPWSGAVTPTSVTVMIRPAASVETVKLEFWPENDPSKRQATPFLRVSPEQDRVVRFEIENLSSDTRYLFVPQFDGYAQRNYAGSFQTFAHGPASFKFAFSSCATSGSNHSVFRTIANHKPLFYLVTGDLYYENIKVNDPAYFNAAWQQVLASPAQSYLYKDVPLIYVWDDHDYGRNNSNRHSPSRQAASFSYQLYAPHYPLIAKQVEDNDHIAIYQEFNVGRVRFILSDLRSERDNHTASDGPDKSMMGTQQKAWFKQALHRAKTDQVPLLFWVSSVPWQAPTKARKDDWGGFDHERRELAQLIDRLNLPMVILSGDAHMLAVFDGKQGPTHQIIPVFHAAPLHRNGSIKGGPYTIGPTLPGKREGQFGLIQVTDDGQQVSLRFSGRNHLDEELMSYSFIPKQP